MDNQGESVRDGMMHRADNWTIDHEDGPCIERGRVIARYELKREKGKRHKVESRKRRKLVKPVDTAVLSGDAVIAGDDAGEGNCEDDSSAGGSSLDVADDAHDDDGKQYWYRTCSNS